MCVLLTLTFTGIKYFDLEIALQKWHINIHVNIQFYGIKNLIVTSKYQYWLSNFGSKNPRGHFLFIYFRVRLSSFALTLRKTQETKASSTERRHIARGRCFHTLVHCLRSAAWLRGVRLIVAGLNGGQSRIVTIEPRTITFRLCEFLAWLGPPLRTPGCNSWRWLSCALTFIKKVAAAIFCLSPSILEFPSRAEKLTLFMVAHWRQLACEQTMGDSLELIGKRLLLLLDDGRSENGSEPEKAAWARDWLRGTVQAVSVIGLTAPEVSGGDATTTSTAAGLTVSVYTQVLRSWNDRVKYNYVLPFTVSMLFMSLNSFLTTNNVPIDCSLMLAYLPMY